jgi:hypothetical protein
LGLTVGKRVVFTQLADGTTIMRAKTRSIVNLRGILRPRGKRKVTTDEMNISRS